jgi:glycosyltransferase involved in cell wall biosynthesis
MKVWLAVNYPPDAIPSMDLFAGSLEQALRQRGVELELLVPPVRAGRWARTAAQRKWLGYVDKLLLFPLWVRFRKIPSMQHDEVIHITDHGNAVWRLWWKSACVIVTLHDLITIRAARGEDTGVHPSRLGRWLQKGIEHGLQATRWVACDSSATRNDFLNLLGPRNPDETRVVLLGLNGTFGPGSDSGSGVRNRLGLASNQSYILHVGNNAPRKNRRILLQVLKQWRVHRPAALVLAGEGLTGDLRNEAAVLGVSSYVHEWPHPSHEDLCALYSDAHALVFPSWTEGFGYPVIEAQACGCPVVSSPCGSLQEVGGDGVIFCAPDDVGGMTQALLALEDVSERWNWRTRGFRNVDRFRPERMAQEYAAFYRQALAAEGRG